MCAPSTVLDISVHLFCCFVLGNAPDLERQTVDFGVIFEASGKMGVQCVWPEGVCVVVCSGT